MKKEFVKPELEFVDIDIELATAEVSPGGGDTVPDPLIPTRK